MNQPIADSGDDPLRLFRRYCLPGRRYIKLLGGNFIRHLDDARLAEFGRWMADDATAASGAELTQMLDGDWRESMTAAWLIGFAKRGEFRLKLQTLLFQTKDRHAPPGYVFALARFGNVEDGEILRRFLTQKWSDPETDGSFILVAGGLLYLDQLHQAGWTDEVLGSDGPWRRWATSRDAQALNPKEVMTRFVEWCSFADRFVS